MKTKIYIVISLFFILVSCGSNIEIEKKLETETETKKAENNTEIYSTGSLQGG